jgi:hypothetical protein
MLGSTNMQNFNSKYLLEWAVQKQQNLTYVVVNGAEFQNFKICQILLLLLSLECKLFRDETLHVCRR